MALTAFSAASAEPKNVSKAFVLCSISALYLTPAVNKAATAELAILAVLPKLDIELPMSWTLVPVVLNLLLRSVNVLPILVNKEASVPNFLSSSVVCIISRCKALY